MPKHKIVRRAPGWITLAGIGLELAVLACAVRIMRWNLQPARRDAPPLRHAFGETERSGQGPSIPQDDGRTAREARNALQFLTENTDTNTRLYRAGDESGLELLAAFLPDGRVRIADNGTHRFAGMIENGRADLLDIANNEWSELFLHVNPNGETQFELRGGPYDARVLTCRPYHHDKVAK